MLYVVCCLSAASIQSPLPSSSRHGLVLQLALAWVSGCYLTDFQVQPRLPASCQALSLSPLLAGNAYAFSACAAMGSLRPLLCSKELVWTPCIPCNCLFSTIALGKARNVGFSGSQQSSQAVRGNLHFQSLSETSSSIPQKLPALFRSSPHVSGKLHRSQIASSNPNTSLCGQLRRSPCCHGA